MRTHALIYRRIAVAAAMLVSNLLYAQQQVQFTQYMFNNLILNPAYAGADERLSLTFINRSQWADLKNSPRTQTLAAHTLSGNRRTGVGFTLQNDRVGVHKNMNGLLVYAYHLKTGSKSVLSMGLQSGFRNSRSDYSSLNGSANDPLVNNLVINRTTFDFGSGIFFRSKSLRFGLSAPSLLTEKIQLNDSMRVSLRARNVFGFVSQIFKISDDVDVMPSTLIKYSPTLPLSFDANVNLIFRKILTLGVAYRRNESIDFLLRAKVTEHLQIGYAYDHPVGTVNRISNGSNEIMVNYLSQPTRRKTYNRIRNRIRR